MARTPEYTPITPMSGGLVHATTLREPFHTACGLKWRGWKIVPHALTCKECEAALSSNQGVKQGFGKRKRGAGKRKQPKARHGRKGK